MSQSLTTLQLARRIADAVIEADCWSPRDGDSAKDRPTQAVMETLDSTGSWFCRVSEDALGATVLTSYEQLDLFRGEEM